MQFDFKNETDLCITAYVDSDWASDPDTRRSTTGYMIFLNRSPISWSCKKQQTVALSSVEAEYMTLSAATQEVVYLKQLFEDLGIEIPIPVIYSDSQGCVQLAQNPCGHSRTKHIDIRHHFIQEKLEAKQIIVKHIPGERNPADGLTKNLGTVLFQRHIPRLMGERND